MISDQFDVHIGVDIIEVVRIRATLRRFGDRFLRKHFTPQEVATCRAKPRPSESLAARFAAKEAFAKAYPGRESLSWQDVEVVMEDGVPRCRLSGPAAAYRAQLSLSHTHTHAVAVVLLKPKEAS